MQNTQEGVHTTRNPEGTRWANVANGLVLSTHNLKAVAVAKGRNVALRFRTTHTIHREDGSVIATRSYEVRPL